MQTTADIFMDDGRQAIHLPDGVCLPGTEVLVRVDEHTGEITLTPHQEGQEQQAKSDWESFFKLRDSISEEERNAFEIPRDRNPPRPRDIF